MYVGDCVAKRTRLKRKQYEEIFEDSGRQEKRSRSRKNDYLGITFVSETKDTGKGKSLHRNKAPKVSKIRGESSKSIVRNKVQGEVKRKKQTSYMYKDAYLIYSDEEEDTFGGKSSKDIESVASATVPNIVAAPHAKEAIQEYYDDIIFGVKDIAKGKDLHREVEKNRGNICKTQNSKVGNKVNKTYHEDEITSKKPNRSYTEAYLLSSDDDDGDSKEKSSEHEESVSSDTDTGTEERSSSTETFVHESSQSSESDPSYVEVVNSQITSLKKNLESPQKPETRRNSAERQQSSIPVEIGSSSSSEEDYLRKEEVKEEEEEEEEEKEEEEEVEKEEDGNVETEKEETNQSPIESRRHLIAEDDTFCILANSILFQDDMLEKMASEKVVEKQQLASAFRLSLKFSFDDEIPKPPEKSDVDKEVDEYLTEMFFSLDCETMGSNSHAKIDKEYAENSETSQTQCDHVYILDEEIGLICRHCHHVKTEIRYILPSFATRTKRFAKEGSVRKEKGAMPDALGLEPSSDCNINSSFETEGTVWDSMRGVRYSLYAHQREGFEFLWRNIGGSIDVSQLRADSSEVGGCIISHAPGTGKTRLAIVFIESYLTLFPRARPIIIAPANMLNTWKEEFEKWKVRFPFHNLNRDEPSGKEDKIAPELISRNNKQRSDVVRMSKLYSWDREESILGISYSLYEKLAGEKRKGMAANEELKEKNNPWRKILLEKPGLVILDEGHTPRNDQSNIWNILVKLQTRKIIMLSGTPFQNNVDELLNSLRLIRPEVVKDLRKERTFSELMPSPRMRSNSSHQYHGRQADPLKDEARGKAIDKLKAAIEPFVHVHKGSILQQMLPGLKEYAMILKPLERQKSLLKELEVPSNSFELEHKIALISVHPRLFELYTSRKERHSGMCQDKLEYSSLLSNEGAKTRFVLELVHLSLTLGEKTLIFSQYKEPLYLIKYLLESKYSWREGQQMFLVEGGLLQNKRQNIIHSFNDPNSEVKVLLASTKCCSEGISLIGASRVVLLDVVWNPSVVMQAISRAYRIGQTKLVYAYHLMLSGTTEVAKYRRQAAKERFSELVFTSTNKEVDEQKRMPKIVASGDKILEAMVGHSSMKDIFERVIDQPKDSNFFR